MLDCRYLANSDDVRIIIVFIIFDIWVKRQGDISSNQEAPMKSEYIQLTLTLATLL